ncbi:Gfo/Idh/MocA family protein [Thalassospira sp.]|uniref:Gfo/Idh/MocA family protein n=1 Tax=Thalassospira sp. TaxID=1912094 RepID=UPI0027375248|nr:Gfo/Idh/MocA family oxidoreductase [Thalassospira sp.]MDP2700168.1 Gfo/Idh/MocA family oxidoreductase [Thalassospira sp.]
MKWGVISTAKIGTDKVIPAMQESDRLEILAIAGRDFEKTRAVAEKLRIPRAYGSYEELLADPTIEAIYNPLPNHLHVEWTIKALEAGKHVLCEKPIGLDTADAKRLIAARDKSGKQVLEAFMVRHHPQWQHARQIVANGEIGDVTTVQSIFTYFNADPDNVRNKKDIGGGGLLDIGCYCVVGPRYILDREPVRVVSLIDKDPKFGTDRLASGILDFGSGIQASFACGTQSAAVQRVHILGTEGRIEIILPFNAVQENPAVIRVGTQKQPGFDEAREISFPVCNQYTLQGEAASAIFAGESTVDYPIEDAIKNMQILDALARSSKTGSWEMVA